MHSAYRKSFAHPFLPHLPLCSQSRATSRPHLLSPVTAQDSRTTSDTMLNDMPPELLGNIFGHLTARDILGLKLVGSVTVSPLTFSNEAPPYEG